MPYKSARSDINVSSTLETFYPDLFARLQRIWCPSPHEVFAGRATGLPLKELERILEDVDLSSMAEKYGLAKAVRKRQISFLGGRLCAERSAEQTDHGPALIDRLSTGEPSWPPSLHGSITHTVDFAFAAVRSSNGCLGFGIDSEPVIAPDEVDSVAAACFADSEMLLLRTFDNPAIFASLVFSSKEAGYKAIHNTVRRFVDFCEYEVKEILWKSRSLTLTPTVPGRGSFLPQVSVRFSMDYRPCLTIHTSSSVDANRVPQNSSS